MTAIHSIDDLWTHTPEEIEETRKSINLREAAIAQMSQSGRRKGLTLDEYRDALDLQDTIEHPKCGACHGHGRLRPHIRRVGSIHPSAAHRCVTRLYYDVLATDAAEEYIPWNLAITFEIGHTVHKIVQTALHGFYGDDFIDEAPVNLPEALVLGGAADGLVDTKTWRALLEIKTISASQFKDLRSPKKEHVLQASIYARALDSPFISFLYVSKEGPDHPIREFVITYDDAVYQDWLRTKVEKVKVGLEAGRPPIADANKYECDQCGFKEICPQRLQKKDPFKR
jgi:CRISPR/Cas system-associated exonuclease Cas4 (RecB family)